MARERSGLMSIALAVIARIYTRETLLIYRAPVHPGKASQINVDLRYASPETVRDLAWFHTPHELRVLSDSWMLGTWDTWDTLMAVACIGHGMCRGQQKSASIGRSDGRLGMKKVSCTTALQSRRREAWGYSQRSWRKSPGTTVVAERQWR